MKDFSLSKDFFQQLIFRIFCSRVLKRQNVYIFQSFKDFDK